VLVLPLYAMLPPAAQRRVFDAPPDGTRLIVIATHYPDVEKKFYRLLVWSAVSGRICRWCAPRAFLRLNPQTRISQQIQSKRTVIESGAALRCSAGGAPRGGATTGWALWTRPASPVLPLTGAGHARTRICGACGSP
jgi:hypothetical protein